VILEAEGVTKRYRRSAAPANDGISLQVEAGEVFGLLGPNGAGKTTLVSQILGVLLPDAGSIRIAGHDVVARPEMARRLCSYQPQATAPVEGLTPREAVDLIGRLRGGRPGDVGRRGEELLGALDLLASADRRVPLSGGMARLVGFCMAAVVPGRVVVLDEPTNDVDPLRRRALWSLVRSLADRGAAVLLVTHNVNESERCVDRLAIVAGGRVLAHGTPSQLKANLGAPLRIDCSLDDPSRPPPLPNIGTGWVATGRRLIGQIQLPEAGDAVSWAKTQLDAGWLVEFSVAPASLEDVYASWVQPDQTQTAGAIG